LIGTEELGSNYTTSLEERFGARISIKMKSVSFECLKKACGLNRKRLDTGTLHYSYLTNHQEGGADATPFTLTGQERANSFIPSRESWNIPNTDTKGGRTERGRGTQLRLTKYT
jgi:hypothetical protein